MSAENNEDVFIFDNTCNKSNYFLKETSLLNARLSGKE